MSGQQPREQVFPYSFKTIGIIDTVIVGYSNTILGSYLIGGEIILPRDFYSCEGLYAHLRYLDTTSNRTIDKAWVVDDPTTPTVYKSIPINNVATSLTNEITLDLSGIRNKTGRNIVLFNFTSAPSGSIKLLKIDMLYQVTGIR